jgi:hypothetical protein
MYPRARATVRSREASVVRGHAVAFVVLVGALGLGCETPDAGLERDREYQAAPVPETQRWAEDDVER